MQVEKALEDRNFEAALDLLEPWAIEVYNNDGSRELVKKLRDEYADVCARAEREKEEAENIRNEYTGVLYTFMDLLHGMSRCQEGVSTPLHKPNHDDPAEVFLYFKKFPIADDEELQWFREQVRSPKATGLDIIAHGMGESLLDCFWFSTLEALIEGIDSPDESISQHCSVAAMSAMFYYNRRLSAYPDICEAFEKAVEKHGDEMLDAFVAHCFSIHECYFGINMPENIDFSNMPEFIKKEMAADGFDPEEAWKEMPRNQESYLQMHKVLDCMIGSWAMHILLQQESEGEDSDKMVSPDSRVGKLCYMFMQIGRPEFLLPEPDKVEDWLTQQIDDEHSLNPRDFLHFGHLYMRKGDKEKAMEYYRRALELCPDRENFFDILRYEKRYLKAYGYGEPSQFDAIEEELRTL